MSGYDRRNGCVDCFFIVHCSLFKNFISLFHFTLCLLQLDFADCVRSVMMATMAPSLNMTVNWRETGIICS